HKANSTCRESLRKLICSSRSAGSRSTRCCSSIRETLNHRSSVFDVDTSVGEQTDVPGHVTEVIDRLVGVLVQLIERTRNIVQRSAEAFRVCKNRLNRSHFEFVLGEPIENRSKRQRLDHLSAGFDRLVSNTR